MSDRYQVMDDQEFWTRLEYDACAWLQSSEEKALRRFWIDGFVPESIKDTKRGADVEGTVWVGDGPRKQYAYRFIASLPQNMLHRRGETFSIEQLVLDEAQQILQVYCRPEPPNLPLQ